MRFWALPYVPISRADSKSPESPSRTQEKQLTHKELITKPPSSTKTRPCDYLSLGISAAASHSEVFGFCQQIAAIVGKTRSVTLPSMVT